jgi:hypothetical protein
MPDELRDQVCAWFDGLPPDAPFGHGLFVDVANERDLYRLWHEQLVFFLRRGGISVYADPAAIEDGYVWRMDEFAQAPTQPAALTSNVGVAGVEEEE